MPSFQFPDHPIWFQWHPLGATGRHLVILSAFGELVIYKVHPFLPLATKASNTSSLNYFSLEYRLQINSPEDYTLHMANATLHEETLWISLENGDVLAVSPLLPFPTQITASIKGKLEEQVSTAKGLKNKRIAQSLLQSIIMSSSQTGIIRRCPPIFKERTLYKIAVQGPLLIQPEPSDFYQGAHCMLAFSLGKRGHSAQELDMLVIANPSTVHNNKSSQQMDVALHLLLLDSPIMPQWDFDKEGTIELSSSSPILTLLETILLPSTCASPQDIQFTSYLSHTGFEVGRRHDVLIIRHANGLSVIDISWIRNYLFKEGGDNLMKSKVWWDFHQSAQVTDYKVSEGSGWVQLTESSTKGGSTLTQKKKLPIDPVKATPLLQELPVFRKTLNIDETHLDRLVLPSLTLPPLKIPPELEKVEFLRVDEDQLMVWLKFLREWRQGIISTCSNYQGQLLTRVAQLIKVGKRQRDWAIQLLDRTKKLLAQSERHQNIEQVLAHHEELLKEISQGSLSSKEPRATLQILMNQVKELEQYVSNQTILTKSHVPSSRLESASSPTNVGAIIDRIQRQIKDIKL